MSYITALESARKRLSNIHLLEHTLVLGLGKQTYRRGDVERSLLETRRHVDGLLKYNVNNELRQGKYDGVKQ